MQQNRKINPICWKSIPHIYNMNTKVLSSIATVAMLFTQFVNMASSLGCFIKLKEILHAHIQLTNNNSTG